MRIKYPVLLALLFSFGLFAAETVAPITVDLTQADGSSFKARPMGNYYVTWMETLDGHAVVENNGNWFYARQLADGSLAAGPNRVGTLPPNQLNALPKGLRPSVDPNQFEKHVPIYHDIANLGTVTQNVVVLLVSYTDISFNYSGSSFESLIFGASSSVKDFYLKNSYNNFVITAASETQGTANDGIIEVSIASAHPNPGQTTSDSRTAAIAAVTAADAFIDYASYDADGSGSVSATELSIVVILAGYENSFGGSSAPTPRVWGHKTSFSTTTLDGVNLAPYTMFGERHGSSTSNFHQATIGIMCHELGHLMLGLPDIYDRDGSSAGVGTWALMAGGSWNRTGSNSGDSPAHMTSWSKIKSGYITPDDIESATTGTTITPASTTSSVKRIWIDEYKAGEYILLDNRQQDSYDAGLSGSGLLVLHIDDSVGTQNDDETHKLVDVEAADGLTEMDSNTNQGNAGDPYPGTSSNTTYNDGSTPNSRDYDNNSTGVAVTSIATALNAQLGSNNITANISPSSNTIKDNISYDEVGVTGSALTYNNDTVYTGIRYTNSTTDMDTLDGVDLYWSDNTATSATVDVMIYSSLNGGSLGTLLHTQTGFTASVGWNRFLLTTAQSFPQGEDRGIVLRINVPGSTAFAYYDNSGPNSGRSYLDSNGSGTFSSLSGHGDLNQRALMSSNCGAAPAISSQPSNTTTCAGSQASFSVTASGTSLTYQWRKDGSNISGATSTTYTIASPVSGDAGSYDCVISDNCAASVTSSAATLTVNAVTAVSSQPAAATVCPGDNVTFTTSATGVSLSYQWRKNGVNISGATSASYTINGVSAGDADSYDCVITGTCGSATSNSAALTVNTATAIASQPQAQTICAGSDATFTVSATGTSLTYQWRKDGTNISGATSSSYTVSGAAASDAADYTCVVSGSCGSTTSNTAALTVNETTAISTQPSGQTACPTDNVTFTVSASGLGLSYQWRKDGVNISGATSASHTVSNVEAGDAGDYTCVVTGTCGSATSATATLAVNSSPSISSQPQAQTICSGSDATFTVAASGTSLTYQWRKDGQNISGATSASHTVSGASSSDAAAYDCVIGSACGSTTSGSAVLTVQDATALSSQPSSQTICPGDNASFSVTATGAALTYQWQKDGQDISGATTATLSITGASSGDAAAYTCVVSGTCGSATSNAATLTVNPATSVSSQPQSQTVCESSAVTFTIVAAGDSLSYQWRKDDQAINGATSASLTLASATGADAGAYTCVVSGSCGSETSSAANLTVNEGAAITSQPQSATLCAGAAANLSITASGSGLSYQWRKDGQDIGGATSSSLSIGSTTTSDSGAYVCVITAACGTVTSSTATLTINPTTAVTSQPQTQTVCESEPVSFTVAAEGANLTYQWRKDGQDIGGAIAANLNLTSVTSADSGSYTCVVSGSCGSETSSAATLTVNEGAAITAQPQGATLCEGSPANFSVTATGSGLTYQWQKDGQNINGAIFNSLSFAQTTTNDAGDYTCVVTSSCGAVTSASASLTVNPSTSISSQPQSQTVCESSAITLTVTAGGSSLTYQWQKDGQDIAGANAAAFNIATTAPSDSGSYTCVVTGSCGTETSSAAVLTVNEGAAITAQPQAAAVCTGAAAAVSVTATGSNLTYQWQKDGGDIAGATSATYDIASAAQSDAGDYACLITAACGTVTSATATLTVNETTQISSQPQSQDVCESAAVTLTVSASGASLNYQWQKDNSDIAGATQASLLIPSAATGDSGSYTCIVTGSCGTETSNAATLTVNEGAGITSQPSGGEICAGDNFSFTVTASGSELSYQWRKDGLDIAGATSASLFLNGVATDASGSYDCVITAGCGALTSAGAQLTVNEATGITSQPQNQTVCEGNSVTLTVAASGNALTYQWRKDGLDIAGAVSASLSIGAVGAGDAGTYDCVVTGSCGSATSSSADITIDNDINITGQPQSAVHCTGETAAFTVAATGSNLTYQWRKDGQDIAGATSATLTLVDLATDNAGAYDCVITGGCGSTTTSAAQLTVNSGAQITSQPQGASLCEGQAFTLVIAVDGTATFQWRKDGQDIAGATAATLILDPLSQADAGDYTCVVNSDCGPATSQVATLEVEAGPPTISGNPVDQDLCVGAVAVFNVTASGSGLSYQWQKDGADLAGANAATLTIDPVAVDDAGSYQCVVANGCDSQTSASAALVVEETISIIDQPDSAEFCIGTSISLTTAATGSSLTYEWFQNGQLIPNQNSSTLALFDLSEADAGDYTCVVSDSCGQLTSDVATLTLLPEPEITSQPVSALACTGGSATFDTAAEGTDLTYQWRLNGNDIGGATGPSLTLDLLDGGDVGDYQCMIGYNCGGILTEIATLTLRPDTTITANPEDVNSCAGETVSFSVAAAEAEGALYQWLKDGLEIAGANTDTLVIQDVGVSDQAVYSCVVSGICNDVTSTGAALQIEPGPQITSHPNSQTQCEGDEVILFAHALGEGVLYQWQLNDQDLPGENSNALFIPALDNSATGSYTCIVSSGCGETATNPAVVAIGSDGINSEIWTLNISLGTQPITLNVNIDCGQPDYNYTWSILGGAVLGSDPNLDINPNDITQTTQYQVEIVDGGGATSSDIITILVSPSGPDPDDDGDNDLDDLILVAQDWTQSGSIFDANGDGILDIRDLLYVNIGNTETLTKSPQ